MTFLTTPLYTNTTYSDDAVMDGQFMYGVITVDGENRSAMTQTTLLLVLTADGDFDHDELTNSEEETEGTNPAKWDTDGDSLPDGWEVYYGLHPLDNGAEEERSEGGRGGGEQLTETLLLEENEGDADPDEDGLDNREEYRNYTDPGSSDTDGDGVSDSDELAGGTDPTDPNNSDPLPQSMLAQTRMVVTCPEEPAEGYDPLGVPDGEHRRTAEAGGDAAGGRVLAAAGQELHVHVEIPRHRLPG